MIGRPTPGDVQAARPRRTRPRLSLATAVDGGRAGKAATVPAAMRSLTVHDDDPDRQPIRIPLPSAVGQAGVFGKVTACPAIARSHARARRHPPDPGQAQMLPLGLAPQGAPRLAAGR